MANVAQMIEVTNQVVALAHHYMKVKENQSDRKGGYLTVLNHRKGEFSLQAKIGQVPADKVHKYQTLATEKAWRLFRNIDHQTSFESRDVNAWISFLNFQTPLSDHSMEKWGQWGGAVRGSRYIFSFSGFPELLDEAMMFALAIKLGELKKDWVIERFAARNKYLVPLLAECGLLK